MGASLCRECGASRSLVAIQDTIVLDNREHVIHLAAKYRLTAMYDLRENVEAGGLLSYGNNFAERFAQANKIQYGFLHHDDLAKKSGHVCPPMHGRRQPAQSSFAVS